MKEYYRVMTFSGNAMPTPIENKTYDTEDKARERMEELKKIYDVPMFVSHVFDNRKNRNLF